MSLLDDMGLSSEAEVLRRVRNGDVATFGVLYERHLGAARRLARSLLADPSDADDVVAEVFAATFAAMRKGRGPADDFRPYVLTSVRRECQRTWRRGGRQRPGGEQVVDLAAARAGDRDEMEQHTEDEVVHHAFASLPVHMREVLWASEVENQSHADIAAQDRLDERGRRPAHRALPPVARRALPRRPPPRRRGPAAGAVRVDPTGARRGRPRHGERHAAPPRRQPPRRLLGVRLGLRSPEGRQPPPPHRPRPRAGAGVRGVQAGAARRAGSMLRLALRIGARRSRLP